MVYTCFSCKWRSDKLPRRSYHKFPSDNQLKQKWLNILRKSNVSIGTRTSLCSLHFDENCFRYGLVNGRKILKDGSLPTLHLTQGDTERVDKIVLPSSSTSNIILALFLSSLQSDGSDFSDEEADKSGFEDEKNIFKETEHSSQSENEIKVFCPKCDTEVSHSAAGIQVDQTKILIAKVYHYFEQEYEELKTIYGDLDLTPLSKFRQRTALATGVSETSVLQILKEEEGRNADKRQEPPDKRIARKRSRQTDSLSEEDSSDDNADDNEESSNVHEAQMVVVKVEPPEYYNEETEIYVPAAVKVEPSDIELNKEQALADPIYLNVKTEPRSDVVDNTNETLALNEPAGAKRKARKIPRSDVASTWQHTPGESSTAAATSSVRLTEQLDESSLFGDTEIKTEEIEIHEEGPS